jgi:hypothetical protein
MRGLRFAAGMVVAMSFALAAAGPAAAYQVISETGPHGDYWLDDSSGTPAGICTYGPVVYDNWAYLVSMRVKAPHVFAADRNSDKRDHRVVTWQWKLQRKKFDATTWKTIKSSAIQKKTAYEDAQAPFTGMTINYNSEKDDMDHNGPSVVFRALVIIKWFKPDGSVESTIKLVPSYYEDRTYWAAPPNTDYCDRVDTNG